MGDSTVNQNGKHNSKTSRKLLMLQGIKSPQHDGVKTTMKKGTPKILSKSISRMPMGSLVGH